MKTASLNLSTKIDFAQFVAADAGNKEALFEQRLSAVYTAYFNAYAYGQKTQLMLVQSACENHKDLKALLKDVPKEAKEHRAALRQAHRVYGAYAAALADASESAPEPKNLKKPVTEVTTIAEDVAARFVQVLTAHLASFDKAPISAEEKAKADAEKAKKAKAKAKAEKEANEKAIAEAVEKRIGAAQPVTLADMVQIVADHIRMGTLDAALHNMLADAAAAYEAQHAIIDVEVSEVETITAQPLAIAA